MAKLHELLAVESSLETQATKVVNELGDLFEKKRHHFEEKRVTFTPNGENEKPKVESQSDIQTTVKSEIDWGMKKVINALNASHAIDVANTLAKADVVVEDSDEVLLKDVPATSLLQLEKRLKELRDFAVKIPTLDPAKGFKQGADRPAGVFQARDVEKTRTKLIQKPVVMYEATKEHPAQVQMANDQVPVGTILEQEWSSLITPATKADIIDNCDRLIRAVKKARARANQMDLDVNGAKIGKQLIDFIFAPLSKKESN